MPNSDVKRGLIPVRYATGSPYMGACNTYSVAASNGTALFAGDPVVRTGDADNSGVAGVTLAAAATAFDGVVVGFTPAQSMDQLGYLPANTAGYVQIADQDNLEYEIQANAAVTSAIVGQNAGLSLAAGDVPMRRSNVELDVGTAATTATLPLNIVGMVQRIDNDPFDAGGNAKVLVRKANGKAGV